MSQLNSLFVQNLTAPVANIFTSLTAPYANIASLVVGNLSGGGTGSLSTAQVAAQTGSFTALTTALLTAATVSVGNVITAPVGNITSLNTQSANIATLVVGNLSGGGGGTLTAGQLVANSSNLAYVTVGNVLTAPLGNITVLNTQTANIATLVVGNLSGGGGGTLTAGQLVANSSNLAYVTVGNVLTAPLGNITVLNTQTANIATLVVGNLSGGGGGTLTAGQLVANSSNLAYVTVGNVLTAPLGNITTLNTQSANIATLVVGNLSGGGGGTLTAGQLVANSSNLAYVTIGNVLTAPLGNITTLNTQSANIATLVVGNLSGGGGGTLTAGQLVANSSNLAYVTIGNVLTAPLGNITSLNTQTANIASLVVGNLSGGGGGTLTAGQLVANSSNLAYVTVGNVLNAPLGNITVLNTQTANIATLVVGNLSGGGGGTLTAGQLVANSSNLAYVNIGNVINAPLGNITSLNTQLANIATLVVGNLSGGGGGTLTAGQLVANSSNLAFVNIGNVLTAPLGNIVTLVSNNVTAAQLLATVSTLGNVQGPLTVSGDIVFTGNLRQTMFANVPGGGLPSYAFSNVTANNLSVTNQANITTLGATTIFCSNIVGYTSGVANTQNITGNSLTYSTGTFSNTLTCNGQLVLNNTVFHNANTWLQNNNLFLRISPDQNHYLGYNANVDGPALMGATGGQLGSIINNVAVMTWNYQNAVFNLPVGITGTQVLSLGYGLTKEASAGRIGYQTYSTALDIVGAGSTAGSRAIRLWDQVSVNTNPGSGYTLDVGGNSRFQTRAAVGSATAPTVLALQNPGGNTGIYFEAGTTTDGNNVGYSAIYFNGYNNNGEQIVNPSRNRWRMYADQRVAGQEGVGFEQYNGTSFINYLRLTNNNVGIFTTTPQYLLHVPPSVTDVPAINPEATNTLLVFEDCRGSTVSAGTLVGNASLQQNNCINLNQPVNGVNGAINYNINPGTAFDVTVDMYSGNSTSQYVADAMYFYVYGSSANPGYAGGSNGYTVMFDEFASSGSPGAYPYSAGLYWNGTLLASQTISTFTVPNNTWTQIRMTFVRNLWRVWYGSQQIFNFQDVSRNLVGSSTLNMGFAGACGGSNAGHYVRNIVISKHTIGHWRPAAGGNVTGISYNGPVTVNGGPLTTVGNVNCTPNGCVNLNAGIRLRISGQHGT